MIVAELILTEGGFGDHGFTHVVGFASLDAAKAEFDRVAEIFKRKEDRKNDLPSMIDIVGDASKVSLPLSSLRSVGLADFAKMNEERAGMRDAFPNVFKV